MSKLITKDEEHAAALTPVTPMHLLSVAVANGADIEKLEKLMALQERWLAGQSRRDFDEAISAAKSEIKPIAKKRQVDFITAKGRTNYSYEDLALIAEEVDPILSKYGLSYRYRSKQEGGKLTVTCVVAHKGGHSEETSLTASNDETGNKNSIQSIASAATYLQRYTLKLALGLSAAKDDDGTNSETVELITDKQHSQLVDLIADTNTDRAKFCGYFKIQSVASLRAVQFEDAKAMLLNKQRAAK